MPIHSLTRRHVGGLAAAAVVTSACKPIAGGGPPAGPDTLGRADAARTVALHLSPGCPFCADVLAEARDPRYGRALGDGTVAFQVLPVYFDGGELRADQLARCTGPGYIETLATLMAAQPAWSATYHRERGAGGEMDYQAQMQGLFETLVVSGTMTEADFIACLDDTAETERLADAYRARRETAEITEVPLMISGDERVAGTSIRDWMRESFAVTA